MNKKNIRRLSLAKSMCIFEENLLMLGKDIKYLYVLFYVKKFENMKSYEVCVKCLYSGCKSFEFIRFLYQTFLQGVLEWKLLLLSRLFFCSFYNLHKIKIVYKHTFYSLTINHVFFFIRPCIIEWYRFHIGIPWYI